MHAFPLPPPPPPHTHTHTHTHSSKQAKKAHHKKLQSLLASSIDTHSTTSSGYTSDTESGDEGDTVMVEDYTALEEEGVTGLQKGKYVLREVTALFMQL